MEPADAREALKYLANNLGLAPEEARTAAFEAEKRMIEYKYSGQGRGRRLHASATRWAGSFRSGAARASGNC